MFFAQLDHIRPTGDRRLGGLLPVAFARRLGNEHIQSNGIKSTGALKCSANRLLDVVEAIAYRFQRGGVSGVDRLAVFLQRPQRLTEPLAGGDDHVIQILPMLLRSGFDCRADIANGISIKQRFGQPAMSCTGKIVPNRFQPGRECFIIQHESAVVFQHAQGLPRAIGVGVEEAQHLGIFRKGHFGDYRVVRIDGL